MTESGANEQADRPDVHSFGERLYAARTRQGLSAEEVASAVNLTVDIIEAIDRSDVSHLPQPTFVQGYLRVYARQVGVPEDIVLEEYSRAVPHKLETELKPRNALPEEATSGSPVVKTVSMLLLIAAVLAVIYGAYSYYRDAVEEMSPVVDDDAESRLIIPTRDYIADDSAATGTGYEFNDVAPEQDLPADESYMEAQSDQPVALDEQPAQMLEPGQVDGPEASEAAPEEILEEREAGIGTERAIYIQTQPVAPGDDVLVLASKQSSWVEVMDANNVQMYYDLMPPENTVMLKGTAPFDVFLGNAPAMGVVLNDVSVDMKKYIRSNNIAHINVSVQNGRVIYH